MPEDERIAAILNPRTGSGRVAEIVELLYANATYSLDERLDVVRSRGNNPYRVEWARINGVRWTGEMICGHNPYLEAYLVDELRVEVNGEGQERLRWKKRARPSNPLLERRIAKGSM